MINFACSCGKQLRTEDVHAGEEVRCPACNSMVVVPDPGFTDRPRRGGPGRASDRFEETPRARGRPPDFRAKREDGPIPSRAGLIIGLSVGGAVLLGAVVTVLIIVLSGGKGSTGSGGLPGGFGGERAKKASENNLRQITLAFHNYNDVNGRLPPAVVYDKTGKPLYSWRVLLLPYLEQDPIYKQFHFDEPWDSPHNRTFSDMVIKTYARPGVNSNQTHYQVFNGPGAAYNAPNPAPPNLLRPFPLVIKGKEEVYEYASNQLRIPASFLDGTSNTILVVEADEGVPWAKPADVAYDTSRPIPRLGGLYSDDVFLVGLADGSPKRINRKRISDTTLRNAINPADGMALGSDW
jgi:hypothetical protein